jgi:hypothetical protein
MYLGDFVGIFNGIAWASRMTGACGQTIYRRIADGKDYNGYTFDNQGDYE